MPTFDPVLLIAAAVLLFAAVCFASAVRALLD
jgi:hypothetical protein